MRMRLMTALALLSSFMCLFCQLEAKEGHLEPKQIHAIMDKIFAEHVDQKQMSKELMQESIRVYIQQFDPQYLYLLRSEVAPYWNLHPASLEGVVKQYNRQNYGVFEKLDALFARAIERARQIRAKIQKQQVAASPLKSAPIKDPKDSTQSLLQFAQTPEVLETRWERKWQQYMQQQMQRFGQSYILAKRGSINEQLEEGLERREQFYLSKQDDGKELPRQEQQHLFSLHILKAIASSLDPHTAFFDDSEAFSMKTHLDKGFEGLGIFLVEGPEGIKINGLVKGGAAEKSGLIDAGDHLMSVRTEQTGEQTVEGKPLSEVLELLRSDHTRPVILMIKKGKKSGKAGQLVEVKLTPQKITLNEDRVKSGYIPFEDGIIGWIALNSFYEGDKGVSSTEDVQNSIEELRKHGPLKGLVLDLRRNGGGYLMQAVKLAGLFIKSGVIVVAKYNNGAEQIYRDTNSSQDYDGPLLILTSRVTASAAEIVAQALQDYGVALVAGDDRTYGKGTIQAQNVTNDKSTSYFKVTVGTYYTVSGKTAQINGVVSDLIVPGPYSLLPIGEMYLQRPLPSDHIAPIFNDTLNDLDLFTRQWYLHAYTPHLQTRSAYWRHMLPTLRTLNQERILNSPNYQRFLRSIQLHSFLAGEKKQPTAMSHHTPDPVEEKEELEKGVPPLIPDDLQLSEALLIVKDMAKLQERGKEEKE